MAPCSESPVGIPRNPNAPVPSPSSSLGPFVEHVAGEEESPAALPFPLLPWTSRRCDVYIGFSGAGDGAALRRLVAWLRAELEAQGIACFAARRGGAAREAAVGAASLGVVVISEGSLSSPCCVEEILRFSEKGALVPLFFGLSKDDFATRMRYGGSENECAAALDALSRAAVRLEADEGNLRDCVFDAVELIGLRLGRKHAAESVRRWRELAADEFPFPRNANFVGRTRELRELELLLFGEAANSRASSVISTCPSEQFAERSKGKGKLPPMWEEFEDDIERSSDGDGVACVVCGDSGIGKTELLLEFAYRFSKRYKLVLWVGGEARYLRENYTKLLPRLGVDVGFGSEAPLGSSRRGSFELMEGDAVGRVRKELAQDIPFLLVIDNVESEKDWWDGRSIAELLPRSGGETHVIISTRLPQISIIKRLRLSYLPSSEALSLMKGSSQGLRIEDVDALRLIEEKIGRLPLGLAIVGAIFSELRIEPLELLNAINDMPIREMTWVTKDDVLLSRNPFLVQLLDLCFSLLHREKNIGKLALRMIEASSWFAPSPIPISMLALAGRGISKGRQQRAQVRKGFARVLSCSCIAPAATKNNSEAEASSMLIRLGLARSCTREGYLSFHDIVNLHARRRSNAEAARSAVVRAIIKEGSVSRHPDHVWAACFLLFRSGTGPVTVNLPTRDLLSFVKQFVLPLASQSFAVFSMHNAMLELLRLSSRALEVLVDSFVSDEKKYASSCFNPKRTSSIGHNPLLYYDLERVQATILDRRATIMMRVCQYVVAEQLCRTTVGIKEVIYGPEHPETRSTCMLMEQSIMYQSKILTC